VDVHALTTAVEQHVTGSPLDRIEAALSLGNELTIGADELIGHFVAGARKAGCSWTEIGERIACQAGRQAAVHAAAACASGAVPPSGRPGWRLLARTRLTRPRWPTAWPRSARTIS
jgi:hypothetical protein